MDPISIILAVLGLGALGFTAFGRFRGVKTMTNEQRLAELLKFAPVAVAAASQLFKIFNNTGQSKDDINAERKNYAMSLMLNLMAALKLEKTSELTTLISGAIEAAVNASKK